MQLTTLNLSNIETIKDINNINWKMYLDNNHKNWIRHIKYPVSQDELSRVCRLSKESESKVLLDNSMGDLYITIK